MENTHCIYSIENITSNKIYIGQTRLFKKRVIKHKSDLKTNSHYNKKLQLDYNNGDIFIFNLLENCAHEDKMIKELFYIKKYKNICPLYNVSLNSRLQKAQLKEYNKSRKVYFFKLKYRTLSEIKSMSLPAYNRLKNQY